MAYVKLDDQIAHHPKVLRAGAEAAWLWACAIAYCNRQLTDGRVPAEALATMGTFKTPVRKLAATLVSVGLFEQDGEGYKVHDYLVDNPDKATVLARLRDAADRKAKYRAGKGHAGDADVPSGQPRPSGGTGASSRASRTSSPPPPIHQTSTTTESVVVEAPAHPSVVDYGPSPAKKFSPATAYHARCGVSVPQFIHDQFMERLRAGGDANPDASLRQWYRTVDDEWVSRKVIVGEPAPKFWEARFAERHGTTTTAGRMTTLQPLEDFIPARFKQPATGGVA